jgi:16S rRNA (adenine1518-N6/adenine1519-N6)-dimethyltransferase
LLARHGLRPSKARSQNFLIDRRVQARIVAAAELSRQDTVVEIGAGLGALTRGLAAAAGHVIAIERDQALAAVLARELAGSLSNLKILVADALETDFTALAAAAGRPLVVVGNLPYQITSPLLFAMLGSAARGATIARAILMVQREFALRTVAPPGSKTYGRLSVMVQQGAAVESLFHVPPGAFFPRPQITSAVMRLIPRPEPLARVKDDGVFEAVVRAAFSTRRKMLRRSLAGVYPAVALAEGLARAGIAGTRRAEELGVGEFARLADALGHDGAGGTAD